MEARVSNLLLKISTGLDEILSNRLLTPRFAKASVQNDSPIWCGHIARVGKQL